MCEISFTERAHCRFSERIRKNFAKRIEFYLFYRTYDGVDTETRKSQSSFQFIYISGEALPSMRLK